MTDNPTLADALARRRIRYERDAGTESDGRMVLTDQDGQRLGRFDVTEAWRFIAEQDAPRDYFVSLIRDGSRRSLLAGPFGTHAEALALVDQARRLACQLDPWCDFDASGTCGLPARIRPAWRAE